MNAREAAAIAERARRRSDALDVSRPNFRALVLDHPQYRAAFADVHLVLPSALTTIREAAEAGLNRRDYELRVYGRPPRIKDAARAAGLADALECELHDLDFNVLTDIIPVQDRDDDGPSSIFFPVSVTW